MDVSVFEGDITTLAVDAIANPANDRLLMGAGVAGAIKSAGGAEIEEDAVAQGPIPLGDAVATGAGSLTARWVVHGAVMSLPELRTDEELIRATVRRCLEVADGLGARSLALPAFGAGVGRIPLDVSARAMVDVVTAFQGESLEAIVLVGYGPEARAAFEQALAA